MSDLPGSGPLQTLAGDLDRQAPDAPFLLSLDRALRLTAADGTVLSLGGARGRAVLALLALAPDHAQPRRLVAGLL